MKKRDIPKIKLQQYYFKLRSLLFTKSRPNETRGIVVNKSPKDIAEEFGEVYFNAKWMLSYNYRGEDINVRREYYSESISDTEFVWSIDLQSDAELFGIDLEKEFTWPWRQLHIRGYKLTNGSVFLTAHEEIAPDGDDWHLDNVNDVPGHAMAHLNGFELNRDLGHMLLLITADRLRFDYTGAHIDDVNIA